MRYWMDTKRRWVAPDHPEWTGKWQVIHVVESAASDCVGKA